MRDIKSIIIHCSATKENEEFTKEDLYKLHVKKNGWSEIGYHYYIPRDGEIHKCRDIKYAGAHVKGHNTSSVGICYEGGLDRDGTPKDTRTAEQKASLAMLIIELREEYGEVPVLGHRNFYDKNGDGIIQQSEMMKSCPCFDPIVEYNRPALLARYLVKAIKTVL